MFNVKIWKRMEKGSWPTSWENDKKCEKKVWENGMKKMKKDRGAR